MKKPHVILSIFMVLGIVTNSCAKRPNPQPNCPDLVSGPLEKSEPPQQQQIEDPTLKLKIGMTKKQVEQILGKPSGSKAMSTKEGTAECIYYAGDVFLGLKTYFLNNRLLAWSTNFYACEQWGVP